MKINPEQFQEYLLAKNALNKIADCAMFQTKIELTPEECRALFSQKIIDLNENSGMVV